jgi:drug/metabolite transporter (DMT)-like permease
MDRIKCPGCGREIRPALSCPMCGFRFQGALGEPQEALPRPWNPARLDRSSPTMAEGSWLGVLAAVLGAAALAGPWVVISILSLGRPSAFTFVVAWAVGPLSIVGSVMAVKLGRSAREQVVGLGGFAAAFVGVALGWVGIGLAVFGLIGSLFGIWGGPLNQLTDVLRTS